MTLSEFRLTLLVGRNYGAQRLGNTEILRFISVCKVRPIGPQTVIRVDLGIQQNAKPATEPYLVSHRCCF